MAHCARIEQKSSSRLASTESAVVGRPTWKSAAQCALSRACRMPYRGRLDSAQTAVIGVATDATRHATPYSSVGEPSAAGAPATVKKVKSAARA